MSEYANWEPEYPATQDRCIQMAKLYERGLHIGEIAQLMKVSTTTVYRGLQPGLRILKAQRQALEELNKETASNG